MRVLLKPGVPGCVTIPLAVMTLGVVPLLMRLGERHFISQMDEEGFETRGGARVAWSEVVRIRRIVGKVKGAKLSDEVQVYSRHGKASLPTWRAENGEEAMIYLLARIPDSAER